MGCGGTQSRWVLTSHDWRSSATARAARWLRRWLWRPGIAAVPTICCQVLLYPGLDRDMTAESMVALPDAPMLSHDDIVYMHELADAGSGAPHDQYRVPAYATDLSALPPAIVVTAECDPIRRLG